MQKKKIFLVAIILIIILILAIVFIMHKKEEKEPINYNDDYEYANGEFNLNLIKTVNDGNRENYLISPYSIEIALSMLKEGANGDTYEEINKVIGDRKINDVTLNKRVSVANAAFIRNKYKDYVIPNYYDILKNNYNSEILYDEYKTPKVINDWVNKKTNGMIEKILDSVNKDFVLGLANALAIDVEWDSPFDCVATRSEKFTKEDNKTINVEMMHKTLEYSEYKYLKDDEATGVIIPYKKYNSETGEETFESGKSLEFVAILPNDSVSNYINNLTEEKLTNLFSNTREASGDFEIELSLPRFKYDYSLDNFMDVLKALGIQKAFDEDNADFTNIMLRNDEIGNLYVGEAIHKTHIDLNEKGTKAAAVTYFGMYKSTGFIHEKEKVKITFDKPFIYMIRDSETKEMLFFGTVYEPNKWNGSTCSNEE